MRLTTVENNCVCVYENSIRSKVYVHENDCVIQKFEFFRGVLYTLCVCKGKCHLYIWKNDMPVEIFSGENLNLFVSDQELFVTEVIDKLLHFRNLNGEVLEETKIEPLVSAGVLFDSFDGDTYVLYDTENKKSIDMITLTNRINWKTIDCSRVVSRFFYRTRITVFCTQQSIMLFSGKQLVELPPRGLSMENISDCGRYFLFEFFSSSAMMKFGTKSIKRFPIGAHVVLQDKYYFIIGDKVKKFPLDNCFYSVLQGATKDPEIAISKFLTSGLFDNHLIPEISNFL